MTTHYVKSWAHFFDEIVKGNKLHDLRKLDRDYKVGDFLALQRYDNIKGEYTGEEVLVEITYITSNKVPCAFSSSALDRDYGIFSLKLVDQIAVPDCENPDTEPTRIVLPYFGPPTRHTPRQLSTERTPEIVKKAVMDGELTVNEGREYFIPNSEPLKITEPFSYKNGGIVVNHEPFLIGEHVNETVIKAPEKKEEKVYLDPVSPNPNAEYYQNR